MGQIQSVGRSGWAAWFAGSMVGIFSTRAAARSALRSVIEGAASNA